MTTRPETFQANLPLVRQDGHSTQETQVALDKLVRALIEAQAHIADLTTRVEALEP